MSNWISTALPNIYGILTIVFYAVCAVGLIGLGVMFIALIIKLIREL